eukprot:CAMPEP_0177466270 /NCGR_PEP_ID=MMETSP0369-20130122/17874_1 /TAXON_ID=447022 ORGANISM="Scrippsiella hangoei-like, Strain SHHI-4" /NCGR_SAMPLE_ID=MMETSP0369 /ASSEMBLY_ACC=CAM_ASM_000364 /LENGTH=354 /DNA_ID=CAMNT_0018940243 /DNA_START=200 /DNA_END=1263 /DNA_ORIENTATION=-
MNASATATVVVGRKLAVEHAISNCRAFWRPATVDRPRVPTLNGLPAEDAKLKVCLPHTPARLTTTPVLSACRACFVALAQAVRAATDNPPAGVRIGLDAAIHHAAELPVVRHVITSLLGDVDQTASPSASAVWHHGWCIESCVRVRVCDHLPVVRRHGDALRHAKVMVDWPPLEEELEHEGVTRRREADDGVDQVAAPVGFLDHLQREKCVQELRLGEVVEEPSLGVLEWYVVIMTEFVMLQSAGSSGMPPCSGTNTAAGEVGVSAHAAAAAGSQRPSAPPRPAAPQPSAVVTEPSESRQEWPSSPEAVEDSACSVAERDGDAGVGSEDCRFGGKTSSRSSSDSSSSMNVFFTS